jgi:hypothetical protein
MTEPTEQKVRPSGLVTASLVLGVLALVLLGLALPVALTGSRDAGAQVSLVLIAASALCGIAAGGLLVATAVQFALAGAKRPGSQRAWISLALILLEIIALRWIVSQWADRFFRW